MIFGMGTPENPSDPDVPGLRIPLSHWLIAAAVSLTVIIAGTLVVELQAREIETRRNVDLLIHGSSLRASLSRELNRALYLMNGLRSYLTVRHDNLQRSEVEAILEGLYRESHHVRNFAVAVGYRLTYIYPVQGNEKAIGLNYPDLPDQWPAVKLAIDREQPILVGPVKLVQGGSGLIYRVPIFIDGRYWGLLSSVLDSRSLLDSALEDSTSSRIALAIRGKDSKGMRGDVFWGEATLFDSKDAQLVDVDVPGGKWVMALQLTDMPDLRALWLMRGLVWLLALTLGWSALALLTQRATLTRQAMFDPLTGLPNRLLADDRISLALAGLRRDPKRTCLLLFIDLDGFKLINDRFGHKAGDAALQSAAARVEDAVRENDTVSRWGGDEFIVFMENAERSNVNEIVTKIRRVVEMPISFDTKELRVGASIGAAYAPEDGDTLDKLVRVADARMYADKAARSGK